ncbi:type VII secretion protein EccC [Nocardioides panacihumi]|uniref:Type VII secretion protein EccC n=1 Tax=Nocardioides panacihumi TaxID=400774 RepID=A0ABP5BV18_9ACTN
MDRIVLRPPPSLGRGESNGALAAALPILGGLGSLSLLATMGGGPRQYVGIGLLVGASILVAALQLERQRRQRARSADALRRDYLAHLTGARHDLRAAGDAQRVAALARHPAPRALAALVEAHSWRPDDGTVVRYGVADLPLTAAPALPEISVGADPVCAQAVRRLAGTYATVPGLPATLDLASVRDLSASEGTARALVCSAAGCAGLVIAVIAAPEALRRWDWVKWLPQAASPLAVDAVGPRRLVAGSMTELAPLLPQRGHVLLVVDGLPRPRPDRPATLLHVADHLAADGRALPGTPDDCPVEVAEAFARRCVAGATDALPAAPDWSTRRPEEHLRVVLGTSDDGSEVVLDLKESALGGSGPHGMVIGATGSGKSELLRALILRLALTHPPDDLNLVLVDFKGGAAFDGLSRLPHVSALITNLADELDLLDRTADALLSELTRRQELVRAGGGDRSGLPTLLVVVDEFAELLAARPELGELFVTLGRLGRSLGIHLLLASQRLDDGRWRGLESHLSFRIGLRTFTAEESRTVLGVADAYELPPSPGVGYLRTAPRTLVRFRAPYVGTVLSLPADPTLLLPFRARRVVGPVPAGVPLVRAAVAAMEGRGQAHQIWLPPLDRPPTLGRLLPGLTLDPARGLGQRSRTVPLGEVDRPRLQRRDRLEVDLTRGSVAIVGVGGSGRSTLLRTAVAGLALTRTPDEVSVHLLDVGGALAPLAGLPHVAGIAGRDDPGLASRIIAELDRGADRPAVLVVDDWTTLRHELPDLEDELARLARRGPARAVRLLVAAGRWSDMGASVRDGFATRIELRLGDPIDSEVDRRLAAAVPRDSPGRGIVDGAHFLAAVPRLGPDDDAAGADEALGALVDAVALHWPGPPRVRLRALPGRVHLDDLPRDERLRLGILEQDDAVRSLPTPGHLLVLGDGGSGRTTLLRTILREITRTRPADQIVVIDPRATLVGEVTAEQLLAHVTGDPTSTVAELATELARRTRGRARGPDVWVVADDLDLLPAAVWQPLVPLLARAGDIGLHVTVARRAGGAGRAIYEPLLSTLRDLRSPGVLLSGSPEDGPLLAGVRARAAPPGRARWVGPDGDEEAFQVALSEPLRLDRSKC